MSLEFNVSYIMLEFPGSYTPGMYSACIGILSFLGYIYPFLSDLILYQALVLLSSKEYYSYREACSLKNLISSMVSKAPTCMSYVDLATCMQLIPFVFFITCSIVFKVLIILACMFISFTRRCAQTIPTYCFWNLRTDAHAKVVQPKFAALLSLLMVSLSLFLQFYYAFMLYLC